LLTGWVTALTPISVDGMIAAASTTLLAESRTGRRREVLPWALMTDQVRRSSTLTANWGLRAGVAALRQAGGPASPVRR
jgi:hypothetical protein